MIDRERLVLGTAKFGMPWYGYGSTSRPSADESIAIILAARHAGIHSFDTAFGYGDAVELLEYAGIPRCEMIIKARQPIPAPDMVHNPTLEDLATIQSWRGVSVYTVEEVAEAHQLGIAPIQAPASCLNRSVDVEYGRAPFLQGTLLRHADRAPVALRSAIFAFQQLAMRANVSRVALALASAYGDRIVFGVSRLDQLTEVLGACWAEVPQEAIDEARSLSSRIDATAALPSLWKGAL